MDNFKVLGLFGFVFAAFGVVLLVWAFSDYRSTSTFVAGATQIEGKVVELIEKITDDAENGRSYAYFPRVEFVDSTGVTRNFISTSGGNPPSYREGDPVEVTFPQNRSEDARINSFMSLWFGPIVMAAFGAIFTLVGGGLLLSLRGRARVPGRPPSGE